MTNIEKVDKLLKNEISAKQTYEQALEKLREDVEFGEAEYLQPIYEDHKAAISNLQERIQQLGGTPSNDSGLWGTWSQIVQGGANMLGRESALNALQEGEKSGAEDYQEAAQDPDVPAEIRSLIETQLLPSQQEHVRTLERLINAAA
jgi:uncharacterized protein (TIGR02284 family)